MTAPVLDVEFCREWFPPLANGMAYFDNAGGTYVPRPVIDGMHAFMSEYQCQPAWDFESSRGVADRLNRSRSLLASAINADTDEIIIGPSTTLNVYVLAHALAPNFAPGDEIVVSNQDHEANSGAWRRLADAGVGIREWRVDPDTGDLDPDDLDALLNERTRLVCFPQVSNIVGSINDVAAITQRVHAAGAMVCVDGVAAVGHHLPDVRDLDVDFYLFSLYKLYGPHLAVLYATRQRIAEAHNQYHFFHEESGATKLNPGGLSYPSVASASGIVDYFEAVHAHHFEAGENQLRARLERVYELFAQHEQSLMARFLAFAGNRHGVRLIGRHSADPRSRSPTFSLALTAQEPKNVADALAKRDIGVGHGHFYGYRTVEALGIDPSTGVLRISMCHYNTIAEVDRLVDALDALL